jgi:hypothetical protein
MSEADVRHWWRAIPLLVIPTLLYTGMAVGLGDEGMRQMLAAQAFSIRLPSGADLQAPRGTLLLGLAAFTLGLEIVKAARPTASAIAENMLAILLFSVSLSLFLLVPAFGTLEFFLITMMQMLDFAASAILMIMVSHKSIVYAVGA